LQRSEHATRQLFPPDRFESLYTSFHLVVSISKLQVIFFVDVDRDVGEVDQFTNGEDLLSEDLHPIVRESLEFFSNCIKVCIQKRSD